MFQKFWTEWSRKKKQNKTKFYTVAPVLNMNILGFVEFWKIIPVFPQEKEFVIKLLKVLNWVNSSVQAIASLGVARKATEGIKKKCVEDIFFFLRFYSV